VPRRPWTAPTTIPGVGRGLTTTVYHLPQSTTSLLVDGRNYQASEVCPLPAGPACHHNLHAGAWMLSASRPLGLSASRPLGLSALYSQRWAIHRMSNHSSRLRLAALSASSPDGAATLLPAPDPLSLLTCSLLTCSLLTCSLFTWMMSPSLSWWWPGLG